MLIEFWISMSNRQLEEAQEAALKKRFADEIGVSFEIFEELAPEISMDNEHPGYVLLEFSEDSPRELLKMVHGLQDGQFSLRLQSCLLDAPFGYNLDDEEWMYSGETSQPYKVFCDSHYHLSDILAEYGEGGSGVLRHSAPVIVRMVFVQLIAALEAYLGDVLVRTVMADRDAVLRLISNDKELLDKSFKLLEIEKKPKLVDETVRSHLQKIVYHNLGRVAVAYKTAFHIDICPSKEVMETLSVAIKLRHDCVHRNGRNKDGEELTQLTTAYVRSILDVTYSFVTRINSEFQRIAL